MKIHHYMNRTAEGRFDSFKMKVRRFIANLVLGAKIAAVLAITFFIGAVTFSTSKTEATTVQAPVIAAVLDRIADCESGNGTKGSATHFKNGQVLLKANVGGSIDIGKYQVNLTYWGKKATDLGYDLTNEADNKAMAEWIYLNKGTGDWSASQKCWYH